MKNERKEELKDEMKNRISMALKDPILQQGFEIICKNLKELEKENQDLRDNYDQFKAIAEPEIEKFQKENAELRVKFLQATDEGTSWYHLKSLERENAELKEKGDKWFVFETEAGNWGMDKATQYTVDRHNYFYGTKEECQKWGVEHKIKDYTGHKYCYDRLDNQFTKAKELLLELYDCIPSSMANSCKETLQKVALFFRDSEVEK